MSLFQVFARCIFLLVQKSVVRFFDIFYVKFDFMSRSPFVSINFHPNWLNIGEDMADCFLSSLSFDEVILKLIFRNFAVVRAQIKLRALGAS